MDHLLLPVELLRLVFTLHRLFLLLLLILLATTSDDNALPAASVAVAATDDGGLNRSTLFTRLEESGSRLFVAAVAADALVVVVGDAVGMTLVLVAPTGPTLFMYWGGVVVGKVVAPPVFVGVTAAAVVAAAAAYCCECE